MIKSLSLISTTRAYIMSSCLSIGLSVFTFTSCNSQLQTIKCFRFQAGQVTIDKHSMSKWCTCKARRRERCSVPCCSDFFSSWFLTKYSGSAESLPGETSDLCAIQLYPFKRERSGGRNHFRGKSNPKTNPALRAPRKSSTIRGLADFCLFFNNLLVTHSYP